MRMDGNTIVYEKRDWVVGWHAKSEGFHINAWQIESFSGKYVIPEGHSDWSTYLDNLRPATQDEINKATQEEKIMVGKYEVKFWFNNSEKQNKIYDYIEICSVTIDKELAQKIMKKAGW